MVDNLKAEEITHFISLLNLYFSSALLGKWIVVIVLNNKKLFRFLSLLRDFCETNLVFLALLQLYSVWIACCA